MRRALLGGIGGVGAALLGSLCCAGPLVFVFFGVGAGLASTFEPLRPLFSVLMIAALGFGFSAVYGRRSTPSASTSSSPGSACTAPRARTRDRVLLWSAAALAALLWTFPYWAILLV